MAEAKLLSDIKGVWTPFIRVTLSKRETAALLTLLGATHGNYIGVSDLYEKVDKLFDSALGVSYRPPALRLDATEELNAGEALDKSFGKV